MDDTKRVKNLFDRWKASFAKKTAKERETANAQTNFEELFYDLSNHKISFDDAKALIPEAVVAHMPSHFVVERVWQISKVNCPGLSKRDWLESWKQTIEGHANAAFHSWYQLPDEDEEDTHVKQHGVMSPMEYSKQRKLADSFHEISPEEIARLKNERETTIEQSLANLDVVLEDDNG